jgi:hypothetical protein
MSDSAQTTGASGGQQPEQKSVLGFPVRPGVDGGAVAAGRLARYVQRGDIVFRDLEDLLAHLRVND